jgi:hypothetical protein
MVHFELITTYNYTTTIHSLCGSSVKGTWRQDSLARDPEGYLEKPLETGISFHRGPVWGTWRRASTGDFESWMKGLWGWAISL